ncbi:MAG: glutathione S-transferase family protein [Deltaproteobacteria bacterium]|nr:glutathione S-transferase family protein [Deltaproteobacteria bacterium]
MKLYHSAQSRSVRPRWLLEELGVPYELVRLNFGNQEHKAPEYMKIHPHGAVPALVDGDIKMFESAAICLYLADKYADKGLAPKIGTPARAAYYQWMVYSMATLEPPIIQIFMNTVMLPEEQRSAKAVEEAKKSFTTIAAVLEQALAGRSFLLGDQFSAADVMVGSTLGWAQFMGVLEGHPTLQAYVARLSERPAFQRAQVD